jgi:hypothetical protein
MSGADGDKTIISQPDRGIPRFHQNRGDRAAHLDVHASRYVGNQHAAGLNEHLLLGVSGNLERAGIMLHGDRAAGPRPQPSRRIRSEFKGGARQPKLKPRPAQASQGGIDKSSSELDFLPLTRDKTEHHTFRARHGPCRCKRGRTQDTKDCRR